MAGSVHISRTRRSIIKSGAAAAIAAKIYNHFEIMETLANPYGICSRAALELLKEK